VSGVILIGGGPSTHNAGLVALGSRLPIVPIATFGGDARTVWEALDSGEDLPTRADQQLFARDWRPDSAERLVQSLAGQIERRALEKKLVREAEEKRRLNIKYYAWLSVILFVLSLSAVPIGWGIGNLSYLSLLFLVYFAPLLAGVSGATIRMVFDSRHGVAPHSAKSVITTVALGLLAGGIAALVFTTTQLGSSPQNAGSNDTTQQAVAAAIQTFQIDLLRALIPAVLVICFTAGFTLG